MKQNEPSIDDVLGRSLPSASQTQMEAGLTRVLNRLRSDRRDTATHIPLAEVENHRSRRWRWVLTMAAAAIVLVAVWVGISWNAGRVTDALATAEGSLDRISNGTSAAVSAGDRIGANETVRSNGGAGAMLALADGSRVEMRSRSELTLGHADDGARIRLTEGSIIVTAAKQRTGHLYVQTKDMMVSVVGTVFLVSAEKDGSRVAVIEGEVSVRQGAAEERLLPGQQVATNPAMTSAPIIEEIAWSRNAEDHVARLQQLVPAPQLPSPVAAQEPKDVFEAATIRLAAPLPSGGRSGGPEPPQARAPVPGALLCIGRLEIDPRRFAVSPMSLQGLIALAYGRDCQSIDQLVGGPDWVRVDGYNVAAVIPVGTPGYSVRQLRNGAAPQLQAMLQNLLADRFKLVIRREMREMAAYNLVVVTDGKLTPAIDSPDRVIRQFPVNGPPPGPSLGMPATTLSRFAGVLPRYMGRPVIDKTGLHGVFDLTLDFPELAGCCTGGADPSPLIAERLPRRLQEDFGLRLEPSRAPVEFLVIERAERPTEN